MRIRSKRKRPTRKADRAARKAITLARMRKSGLPRPQYHLPAIYFDPNMTFGSHKAAQKTEKAVEFLYERLSEGKGWRYRKKKLTALKILCMNLIQLEPFNDTSERYRNVLAIPMDENKYWKNIQLKHLTGIPMLVNLLKDEGLIDMKAGSGFPEKKKYHITKIWPTPDFIKVIGRPLRIDNETVLYTGDLIQLRDENKNALPYTDTNETRRIRKILKRVNRLNGQYHVKYRICNGVMGSLHTDLHAIFNQKLTWGGRLYTRHGESYQNLPQKDRATIEIAGEPTVELDYSGLHPRLLYAEMDKQFPADSDPYKMVYDTEDKNLRSCLKIVLLGILNASDRTKATQAASKALKDSRKHCKAKRQTKKRVTYFIDRFEQAHGPIKHFFYTIRGRKLMNKDSKIALRIIDHFAKQDLPILVVHDSFITLERLEDELRGTMDAAYKAETGGFTCPITNK